MQRSADQRLGRVVWAARPILGAAPVSGVSYYTYSQHKTHQAALDALRGYLAAGIVSEDEGARIMRLGPGKWAVLFPRPVEPRPSP